MFEYLPSATNWALHAATAGIVLFAIGWIAVRRISDPARRQQLAGWVIRAALLVAGLCALPAWLLLPLPVEATVSDSTPVAVVKPDPPTEPLQPTPQREAAPEPVPTELWVIVVPTVEEFPPSPVPHPADEREAIAPAEMAASEPLVVRTPSVIMVEVPTPPSSPWPGIIRLVMLAYGVGVAIAAVPLLIGAIALARLRHHAKPASARLQTLFDELAGGLPVRLRVASHLGSPVCFGLFRPVVVLPVELTDAADAELRWVFAHELDHLRRGDPWTNWWVSVAKAIYFAVPWFWCVRRDLLLTQEFLADAAAAALGRVEDYASFLVRLSEGPVGRRHPVGANAVRAGKSDLYRRVTMLLSANARSTSRASRRWSVAVASVAVGLAVVLSGIGFANPTAPPPNPIAPQPPLNVPNPPDIVAPEALVAPPVGVPVYRGPQLMIPVLGVAQIQALPIRHVAVPVIPNGVQVTPMLVPLPNPVGVAQSVPRIVPLPDPLAGGLAANGNSLPAQFGPTDPAAIQLLAKMDQLTAKLIAEQAANADDKDEKIRALKLELEKLAKDLEKLQGAPGPLGLGGKRVVVGGGQLPGGAGGWVEVAPGLGGFGGVSVESRLGVLVDRVSPVLADQLDLPKGQGVVITGVIKDQAADKAGLKANDIVLEFAGKAVADNPTEFQKAVNAVKVGDKVDLVVLRKGKKETIKGVEVPEAKRSAFVQPVNPGVFQPIRPLNVIPPVPGIPGKPVVIPLNVNPAIIPAPGGPGQRSIQVQIDNDTFSIQASEGGEQYTIEGKAKDGKPDPTRIVIVSDGEVIKVQSIDKVPEKHKERVKQLLDNVKFGK